MTSTEPTVTDADAERLIDRSSVGVLLDELDPRARPAVVDLMVRLAALADAIPEISLVRLNPVIVAAHRPGEAAKANITDARITLCPVPPEPRPPVRRL